MGIVQPTAFIQESVPPTYLGFTTGSAVYLNANNRTSYPGSGSVWYDISGNGRNAGITGSFSFTNGGTGSVSYFTAPGGTGSIANIELKSAIGTAGGTGSLTFGGWCNIPIIQPFTGETYSYYYTPLHRYGNSNNADQLLQSISYNPTDDYRLFGYFNGAVGTAYFLSTDNYFYNWRSRWVHIMTQWTYKASPDVGSNLRTYVNGALQAWSQETTAIASNDRLFRIASASDNTEYRIGSFATFEAYDRFLSRDEIFGNFNVSASFYGY